MRNRGYKLLVVMSTAGVAAVAVFGFILFTALVLEPNWIIVDRVVIEDEKLARALGGMTIAQISDLHLRDSLGFKEKQLIGKVNRLQPDMIVITGDLVEDPDAVPVVEEFVRRLKPGTWSYGILGNSDRIHLSGKVFDDRWRRAGLSLIGGSCRTMGGEGAGTFWLGGIDFPGYEVPGIEAEVDRILKDVPPSAPLIFLSYDPDLAPLLVSKGADLVLSGDTHGGLIGLPGWPEVFHRVFGRSEFVRGLYPIGKGLLYVNRGIATKVLPVRFLCPPEITLFEFKNPSAN